ncbi:hypothetical protein DP114_15490 [Brasilonema sennae CENA114]|uniref:Uncharacterized protein n=1 Tax=Brasilonema sennae CENA114 TaxID=415709 RepID=A0A856MFQ9_9CYAN|nr:hypothetical protein DP114_15490 [Brasilonema sennae CENA114]
MVNITLQGVENQTAGLNSQDDVIKSLKIVVVIKSTVLVYLQVEIDTARACWRNQESPGVSQICKFILFCSAHRSAL